MTDTHRLNDKFDDPDLVDRIFAYIVEQLPELAGRADEVEEAVRTEFGGEQAYVPKRSAAKRAELQAKVRGMFNGRNASEVARELSIGRTTVYRLLKKEGDE
jgi:Mor family transcriptional regulator